MELISKMQAKDCRIRILNLKQFRLDKGLTIEQCVEMCGNYPSEWTVRKFFTKGSEDKATFKESTVAAIELALIGKVYEPNIKIPVVDVTRTLEDAVTPLANENRLLRYTVDRQAHIIKTLSRMVLACLVFFGSIALYDYFSHSTGFWNTDSYFVWIIKVAFLLCILGSMLWSFVKLKALKKRFDAEEKQLSEGGL